MKKVREKRLSRISGQNRRVTKLAVREVSQRVNEPVGQKLEHRVGNAFGHLRSESFQQQNEDLLEKDQKSAGKGTEYHFMPEPTCYKTRNESTVNRLYEKGKKSAGMFTR